MRRVEPFQLNVSSENAEMQNSEEYQKEMERLREIAKKDIISREQQKFRASFADFTNLVQIAKESNLRNEEIPFAITMAIAAQFAAFLLKYQTKEIEKIGLNVIRNMYQVIQKIGAVKEMTPNEYLSITLTDIPLLATSVIPSLTGPQIERMKNTINVLIAPLLMKIVDRNFKTFKGKGQLRGGEGNDDESDNEENVAPEDQSENPLLRDDDDVVPDENPKPGVLGTIKNWFGALGDYVYSLRTDRTESAPVPKTEEELAKLPPKQKQALQDSQEIWEAKVQDEVQTERWIEDYLKQKKAEEKKYKNPAQLEKFRQKYENQAEKYRMQLVDQKIDRWRKTGKPKELPRWEPKTLETPRLQTPWQKFLGLNYFLAPFIQAIARPTIKRAEYVNQMPNDFKLVDLQYLRHSEDFLRDVERAVDQVMGYYGEQLAYHGLINSASDFNRLGLEKYIETVGEVKDILNLTGTEAAQKTMQTLFDRFLKDKDLQANLPQLTSENMFQAITTNTSSQPLFNKTEVLQRAEEQKAEAAAKANVTSVGTRIGSFFRKLNPFASDTPAENQTTENQASVKQWRRPFFSPVIPFEENYKAWKDRENRARVLKILEDYHEARAKRYDQTYGNPDTIDRLYRTQILNPEGFTKMDRLNNIARSNHMYREAHADAERILADDGQASADYTDQRLLDGVRNELGIEPVHMNLTQHVWDETQTEHVLQGALMKIYTVFGDTVENVDGGELMLIKNSHEILKDLEEVQKTLTYMQTNSSKSSQQVQEVLDFTNTLIAKVKPIANNRKIPPPGYWKSLYWSVLDWIEKDKNENWFAKRLYNTFKGSILEKNAYDFQTATGLGSVTSRSLAGVKMVLGSAGVGTIILFKWGKQMLSYFWNFLKRWFVKKTVEVTKSEEAGKFLGEAIQSGERAIQEAMDAAWERNQRYRAKTLELSMKGARTAAKLGIAAATAMTGAPTALSSIGALASQIQRNKELKDRIEDQPRSANPAVTEMRKLIMKRLNEANKENEGKIKEIQKTRNAIASKFKTVLPDIASWLKPSQQSTKSSSGRSSSKSTSLASVASAAKKRLDEKAKKEEQEKEKEKKEQKKTKKEAAALVSQLQKDYEKKLEKYEKELEQYQSSQPKGTKHLKTKPVKIAKTKKPRKTSTAKILPKKPRLTFALQQTTKAKKPTKGKVRTHALNIRSSKRARKI